MSDIDTLLQEMRPLRAAATGEDVEYQSHPAGGPVGSWTALVTSGPIVGSTEGDDQRDGRTARGSHPLLVTLLKSDVPSLRLEHDRLRKLGESQEYILHHVEVETATEYQVYCAPTD